MNKKILFTLSLLSMLVFLSACGGGGGGGSVSSPPGGTPDVPAAVRLAVSQFIVQTGSSISLRAKVLDANGKVLPGVIVSFSTTFGTLSAASATTNASGIATVTISSGAADFATIVAAVSALSDSKTVQFTSSVSGSPTMSLVVNSVPGNGTYDELSDITLFESSGDDTVTILATVLDGSGNPASGELIIWGADSSRVIFSSPTSTTNASGQAIVSVNVTSSILNAEIFVTIFANASNGASNMKTLLLKPVVVDAATSFLTANPLTVSTGGTSAVTAVVKLNTGTTAPDGTTVNFTTTCGIVTPFSQTTGGVAAATFTAPLSTGTCTVTGKIAGVTIGTVGILATTPLNVIPNPLTVSTTGAKVFTIIGGTGPYTATSNNALVTVPAGTFAGPSLTATVLSMPAIDTDVTITVYDSLGTSKTATLKLDVAPLVTLNVIPNPLTVSSPGPAVFTIFGGTPPYTATSDNALVTMPVVQPFVSPLTATVTGMPATNTDVTITVYDFLGASDTTTLKLDVTGVSLNVNPSAITLTGFNEPPANTTDDVTFTITGGTPPYQMVSDNGAVIAGQNPAPSTFTIDPTAVTGTTTVLLTVTDSLGASKQVTVKVTPTPATLALSPSSITVPTSTAVNLYILNGATGTFDLYTSDSTCVTIPGTTTSLNPFTVNTTLVPTCSSTITIVNTANGQVATATITVP